MLSRTDLKEERVSRVLMESGVEEHRRMAEGKKELRWELCLIEGLSS